MAKDTVAGNRASSEIRRDACAPDDLSGTLVECHECGLFQTIGHVVKGMVVSCAGCGNILIDAKPQKPTRALAYLSTALILFIIANTFPFMSFEMRGREEQSILISGVVEFFQRGFWELGVLVFAAAVLVPAIMIIGYIALLVPLSLGRTPGYAASLLRVLQILRPWSMAEVFIFGVIVAYVKLSDLANLTIGVGCYAFVAMVLMLIAAESHMSSQHVWNRIRRSAQSVVAGYLRQTDVAGCPVCGYVCKMPSHSRVTELDCPRCGAEVTHRKPNSMSRTWALVIAAAALYIPANTYPMLTVVSFGSSNADTIISGVVELIAAGMWPVAAIVFFASILVPLLKLIGLTFLLITVHIRSSWRPKHRTKLYRIIEFIGRWSMIDIFMISILIALVQLGNIATINPGPAAIAFAAVVILTMLASRSFDSRLIWDAAREGMTINDDGNSGTARATGGGGQAAPSHLAGMAGSDHRGGGSRLACL